MKSLHLLRLPIRALWVLQAGLVGFAENAPTLLPDEAVQREPDPTPIARGGGIRLEQPIALSNGGWRLTWSSEPGRRYLVQKWQGEDLSETGDPLWTTIESASATTATISVEDRTTAAARQRYYRVVQVPLPPADAQGPVLAAFRADPLGATVQSNVRLSVRVLESSTVVSVQFFADTVRLGTAQREGDAWFVRVGFAEIQNAKRLYVRAQDSAGHTSSADLAVPALTAVSRRFVALDAQGRPLDGVNVALTTGSVLPSLEFRPAGEERALNASTLVVQLPKGGAIAEVSGRQVIRANEVELRFGRDTALRFAADLLPKLRVGLAQGRRGLGVAAVSPSTEVVRIVSDVPLDLPMGSWSAADVEQVLGLVAGSGVPVRVFDRHELRWHAGVLEADGIRGARFQFEGLPLPVLSGDYPDFVFPLDARDEVRLPYYGEFPLARTMGEGPTLLVGPDDPAWLTLRANGSVGYRNRSQLSLPGGGRVRADITLDQPIYRMQFFADGVHLPMLASLTDLLPANPGICLPAGNDPAQLGLATRCLDSLANAYVHFAASAAGAAIPAADSSDHTLAAPPADVATATSVLEAWSYSGLAALVGSAPIGDLRKLIQQTGQSAEAATDLETVLQHRLALARARLAVGKGALSGDASARADLDSALAQAEAAAIARARDPQAVASLESLGQCLEHVLETKAIFQEANLVPGPALGLALGQLLRDFLERHVGDLGVVAGQFTPVANPVVSNMNRFTAAEHIRDLLDLLAHAALLGVETLMQSPVDEALSQLALRLFAQVEVALNAAEAEADPVSFSYAFEDLLDLIAARQLAIFPNVPALAGLPDTATVGPYVDRLGVLLQADLAKPYAARSLTSHSLQVRRLLRILREMPASVTLASAPFERAAERMEEAMATGLGGLAANHDPGALLELLEAGMVHEALRVRFNLASSLNWESTGLLTVAQRLGEVGGTRAAWSELQRAFRLLHAEAERFRALNDGPRRRLYLDQTIPILVGARAAAVAVWQSQGSRRASDPALYLADMLLPGDIRVDRVAGAASFHWITEVFRGSFQGRLRLPKFGGELEILGASFSTAGAWDLAAHGTMTFGGVTVGLARRQPLELQFRAPNALRLSGEGVLQLPNGMSFNARLTLDEPRYGFRIEAQDLRFELVRELALLRPTLDLNQVGQANDALRSALLDYYVGLNAALDGVSRQASELPPLEVDQPGQPPAFEPPQWSRPFSEVSAWAESVRLDVTRTLTRSYESTTAGLRDALSTVRQDAELAAEAFDSENRFLEHQLARLQQQRRGAEAAKLAADNALIPGGDSSPLFEELRDSLRQEARLNARFLHAHPPADLVEVHRTIMALLDIAATREVINGSLEDLDGDGLPNATDSCPTDKHEGVGPAPDQDNDGMGDACDPAPSNPAVPGPGPCGTYWKLAGNPVAQAQALLDCRMGQEYLQLGLDPSTGALTNAAALDGLSSEDLQLRLLVLESLAAQTESLGVNAGPIQAASAALGKQLLERRRGELQSTPADQTLRRYDLALEVADLSLWLHGAQADASVAADLQAAVPVLGTLSNEELAQLEADRMARKAARLTRLEQALGRELGEDLGGDLDLLAQARRRGVVGDSLILFKVLFAQPTPANRVYFERIDSLIRYKVKRLQEELVAPDFLQGRLSEGARMAQTLAEAIAWVTEYIPSDPQQTADIQSGLNALAQQWAPLAETQRAWGLLHLYGSTLDQLLRDYGATMNAALRDACRQAFAGSVLAATRITDALVLLAGSLSSEELAMKLPGALKVRRAFGGIQFERDTEVWTGTFGGKLQFPDVQNASFEISEATVATDGRFEIAAATAGPLPFGQLKLAASLSLSGNHLGLQQVGGSGTLQVPDRNTVRSYTVGATYHPAEQRLSFDALGAGLQWRLSDDFVLFDGGFGFDLTAGVPEALRFRGSVGLMARQEPLPEVLSRSAFHLIVTNAAIRLGVSDVAFSTTLSSGVLLLPEFLRPSLCQTNPIMTNFLASPAGQASELKGLVSLTAPPPAPGTYGPSVALSPANPLQVVLPFDASPMQVTGEVSFRDLGLRIPEFEALELAVCQAKLVFPSNQLPVLTNLYAALQFPLAEKTNVIEVVDAAWSLGGLPTGTVRLRTNFDVFARDDWRLTMLGTQSGICPAGTGITIARDAADQLFLRFDSGVEFAIPADVITDESLGPVRSAACGSLTVPLTGLPQFQLDALAVGVQHARLGGAQGVALTNATLQISGLTNLFQMSPATPFSVGLSGTLLVGPAAGLGLSNAVFRFEGQPLPRFTIAELSVLRPESIFGLAEGLPMTLDEGKVRFLQVDAPLPQLFAATNLAVMISGSVALPPGPTPVLGSRVRDLLVTFSPNGVPQFSVDAIGFTVDLTSLVGDDLPLTLGGDLYVGGLRTPPNFLFSGKLRGKFKGNAIEALMAVDPCGIRGVCFGLAGSEISIQLAYGFVLTGAKGGLSFANSNADPCEFLTYLPIDPVTGKPIGGSACLLPIPTNCPPAITLEELLGRPRGQTAPIFIASQPTPLSGRFAEARAADRAVGLLAAQTTPVESFPCPALGECPPASVNILCQPHPDSSGSGETNSPHRNRVILKFTAIDEAVLNAIGITRDAAATWVPAFSTNKKQIAMDIARSVRGYIDVLTPRPPANAPETIRALESQINDTLDAIVLGFANGIHCAIDLLPANSALLASLIYETIRDTVWAGLPCPDETIKLEGSVSYTGLSMFANVSGGVVISTTGSAGVVGAVNVFGIPVGQARVFVSATDALGNPTLPAICGEVRAAIGPLELGSLALLEDCPGCLDRFVGAFANLAGALSSAYVFSVMSQVLPELADPNLNATQHLARLDTPDRQWIFLGAVMNAPPRDANGVIPRAFLDFAANLANVMVPRYAMCGTVEPKLFGIPLSSGTLSEYQFYAGPKLVDNRVEGLILRDSYGFSPIQMLSYYALAVTGVGAGLTFLVPTVDEAHASTSFELPSPGQLVREGLTTSPPLFAARRIEDFIKNATITYDYRLAPFGMELGRAGGRILMPSLEHHPRGPNPRTPPANRNQGLPDRLEVLMAALGDKDETNAVNRLSDVTWKGEGDADFQDIFRGSSFESAVRRRNLSLRDDYFPHGGFLGAGILDMPKILTRPLPESLFIALDPKEAALDRLVALQSFISDHVLATERVGEVAYYLPAPNPPLNQFPTTAQGLIESLRGFVPDDPLHLASYYPVDQGFFSGWVDTPILGIPTIRSKITWQPADDLFRLEAKVPPASWFNRMVGQANLLVDFRGRARQTNSIAERFGAISNQVAGLNPASADLVQRVNAIATSLPEDLADGLPRIAMTLNAAQVRIPVPTYNPSAPLPLLQTVATITNASLEAYSPFYRLEGATGNGPRDRARRDGGFAIRGNLNFMNGLVQVANAEFAVTPSANALGLPLLSAEWTGSTLNLFGIPFGPVPTAASAAAPAVSSGANSSTHRSFSPSRVGLLAGVASGPRFEFASGPTVVRLAANGSVPELPLGPFFTLKPITGTSIAATASFETTTSALPQGQLSLSPSRLVATWFPAETLVRLHGATANDPFTIRADGAWSAGATIPGDDSLSIFFGGQRVLRLTRPQSARSAPFRASIAGDGFTQATLTLTNLALGVTIQSYPDAPASDLRRRTFNLGAGAQASLSVGSGGAFELNATIPSPLALSGLPLASLQGGYQFRLTQDSVRFSGNSAGGLVEQLGGPSLNVTLTAGPAAWSFSATTQLPKLIFGVFDLHQLNGLNRVGPTVTVSSTGIAFGGNLRVQVAGTAASSPYLALEPFTMASNGSFAANGNQSLSWEGRSLGTASLQLVRTPTGVVTLTGAGSLAPITLTGFGSIQPVTGSRINASLQLGSDGTGTLRLDPAKLRLSGVGVTIDGTLHGAAGVSDPFTFSAQGPWSAAATFDSFAADPLGSGAYNPPELLRLASSTGGALFTASVTGDQGNLTSLQGTRTGAVRFELLKGSPMEKIFNSVNVGTATFALTNSPRQMVVMLDPPNLTYATNFVVGDKPITTQLFTLSSGSLKATLGSGGGEQSLKLEAPTLTLLPGTYLEKTLGDLPTQELVSAGSISEGNGSAFRVFTGTPVRTLNFSGLPVLRLPSGSAGTELLRLHPAGFDAQIPFQEGANYDGLISFSGFSGSGGLALSFSGSWLRLRFATGPQVTVLGKTLSTAGGEAIVGANTGGAFRATFQATDNPAKSLGFNLLSFHPSGTLVLEGIANSSSPDFNLAGNFSVHLAYPNPTNPTNILTVRRDMGFDLEAGEDFSATLNNGLPTFDLGWLAVSPGSIVIARDGVSGEFSVNFNDWDIEVLGKSFNDQDFALSTAGVLTRNLSSSTFDLGISGAGSLLRLVTGGVVPFDWRVHTTGSNAGTVVLDLPSTTTLSFPNLTLLTGTLHNGLGLASALTDIPASGTFDKTWDRSVSLNGLSFGSSSIRLRRDTYGGPILFSATRDDALGLEGLRLGVSADTSDASSFAAKLTGTFTAFGYTFGRINLSLDFNNPTYPFRGTATIGGVANQTLKIGLPGVVFVLGDSELGPFPLP